MISQPACHGSKCRTKYVYDAASRRTQQTRIDGSYVNYGYDGAGQLLTASGKESGGSPSRAQEQIGYYYDAAGNLNRRTNNALTQTFSVDSLNQLSGASRSGTLTVAGTTGGTATNVTVNGLAASLYGDGTFARAGFTVTNGDNGFTASGQDALGRQDSQTITVNLPASVSYSYDANGNLLSDGKRSFVYDDENQLTQVYETNRWRSDFLYDGKMRRRIATQYAWSSGAWLKTNEIRYVYDGSLVIQERDANNIPLVNYTRGRDLSGSLSGAGGIGGLLARSDGVGSNHAFYHCDGNGNVTALINPQQALVAKYLYDPFGNLLALSGVLADQNRYRFSSKEVELSAGLIYYLYRYYDPNLQRWLNRDPLGDPGFMVVNNATDRGQTADLNGQGASHLAGVGEASLENSLLNLFRFVGNNPIDYADPLGLAYDRCELLTWKSRCVAYKAVRVSAYFSLGVCTRRSCFFRCYCNNRKNCPNFPCNDARCRLDHGNEEPGGIVSSGSGPHGGVLPTDCNQNLVTAMLRGNCGTGPSLIP